VNYENQVKNSSDEFLLNGDLVDDFLVGTQDVHLADDQSAKWKLSFLFSDNLESPTYINIM
ncbi:8465_t:CDS:1, partial [Scutellospora calospora]